MKTKFKLGKPQVFAIICIVIGLLLGAYNRGVFANELLNMDIGTLDTESNAMSCSLNMVEHLGVKKDPKEFVVDNKFTFFETEEQGALIYDNRLLLEISNETIPYSFLENVLNVYYDYKTDRLIYINTVNPVTEDNPLLTKDIIFTVIDVVKFKEGYNYYILEFNNCVNPE